MRKLFFGVALAAVLGTPVMAQDGPTDSPFSSRQFQVWGRATTNAFDPSGSDPDEDYEPDHPGQHNAVSAMSSKGDATAACAGDMTVGLTAGALTCSSVATGFTNMASNTDPVAATRGEYNCRARTEAGAVVYLGDVEADPTVADKTVQVDLVFTGHRDADSMGERTVGGSGKVRISRADGTIEDYKVDVVRNGWKIHGVNNSLDENEDYTFDLTVTLGHGDAIGLTSVAEARSTDADGEVYSILSLTVTATVRTDDDDESGDDDDDESGDDDDDESGDDDDDESGDDDDDDESGDYGSKVDENPSPLAASSKDVMISGRTYS